AKELKDSKAIVNPRNVDVIHLKGTEAQIYGYVGETERLDVVQKIDFDVAVTAEKGSETKGGIGIHVGTIALGTQGRSENTNSTVSRIRFSIPMVLPSENARTKSATAI
ncbi:MAG TPA: hypothetical protein VNT99_10440, partial [Methylomirabilota bacterium]|nr:hypothetical protein [Methylomirabilota bacterium]